MGVLEEVGIFLFYMFLIQSEQRNNPHPFMLNFDLLLAI